MSEETDYIRIDPAVSFNRFCVVVMHYNKSSDEFVQFRCSQSLPKPAADALALSWAAAMRLEIR